MVVSEYVDREAVRDWDKFPFPVKGMRRGMRCTSSLGELKGMF
jgi:hypothetical protein